MPVRREQFTSWLRRSRCWRSPACGSSSKSSSSGGDTTTTRGARRRVRTSRSTRRSSAYTLPAQIPAGWVDVTLHELGQGRSPDRVREAGLDVVRGVQGGRVDDRREGARRRAVRRRSEQRRSGRVGHRDGAPRRRATYGVACFIPDDKDGKPHAEHGMVGQVNVVQTADSVEDAPKVDGGTSR